MNLFRFTVGLALIVGCGLIVSNSSGPAANNTRATGAPGDGGNTCVTCHNNSGSFGDVSISFELQNGSGSAVTEYKADSVYQVKVTVENSSGTPAGYGFQMICLDDENDDNYNGWANPSANAQLSTSASRNYVEHNAISSTNEFTVDWTAPEEGTGDVTFYIGGNAVNGANGTGGDRAAIDEFTISEAAPDTTANGIRDLNVAAWKVFPNPVSDVLYLEALEVVPSLVIYNAQGQLVSSSDVHENSIDVSHLKTGFYTIVNPKNKTTQKVFKL